MIKILNIVIVIVVTNMDGHLATIPYYQRAAENKLLSNARQLAEELCITFDQAMSLAKNMDKPLTRVALWK